MKDKEPGTFMTREFCFDSLVEIMEPLLQNSEILFIDSSVGGVRFRH